MQGSRQISQSECRIPDKLANQNAGFNRPHMHVPGHLGLRVLRVLTRFPAKPAGNRSVAHFVAHFVAQWLLCGSCGSQGQKGTKGEGDTKGEGKRNGTTVFHS